MPVTGKAADVFGRKTVFLLTLTLFTVASVMCAFAPDMPSLIAFRILQGIGGGGFLPCASAIVSEEFPENRQRMIGLFSSILPFGNIVGPNLGGWLVEAYGWRSTFWLTAAIGVVVALACWAMVRKTARKEAGALDLVGTGLLGGGLFSVMLALTEAGNSRSTSSLLYVGALLAVGAAFLVLFMRRQNRIKSPLIDMAVLRRKPFAAANVFNLLYGMSAFGVLTLVPLYTVTVYGKTIMESGFILTPRFIGMMALSTVSSFFLVRWGYRKPIFIGLGALVLGLVLLALEPAGFLIAGFSVSDTALLLIVTGICGAGIGMISPASNNACIELMPDRVATITGVRGMFRHSGQAIAIAISTAVIQLMGNASVAFTIIFLAWAGVMVLSIPGVLMMPSHPTVPTNSW